MPRILNVTFTVFFALTIAVAVPSVRAARPRPAPSKPPAPKPARSKPPSSPTLLTRAAFGKGPETITFERFTGRGGFYPLREIGRNARGHYDEIVSKNGRKFARGVKLLAAGCSVRYPDLGQGQIVRMLDGLYRLDSVTKAAATFKRLKRMEFPKGLSVAKGSYGFPIGRLGSSFGPGSYDAPTFVASQASIARDGRAQVNVAVYTGNRGWHQRVVHKGDIVWIGYHGHRMLNIVPSDPKRGIVGWVDFDPKVAGLRGPASFHLWKRTRGPIPPPPGPLGFVSNRGEPTRDGKSGLKSFSFQAKADAPGLFDHAVADRFRIDCGRVDVGEAVRMLDGVYRLADENGLFKRVPNKDLPPHARPAPHSYGMPLNGSTILHQVPNSNYVHRIEFTEHRTRKPIKPASPKAEDGAKGRGKTQVNEAHALVWGQIYKELQGKVKTLVRTSNAQWIKEGDILWIGPYGHRVKKIVLPDPKRKIAGWVDIDQDVAETKKGGGEKGAAGEKGTQPFS